MRKNKNTVMTTEGNEETKLKFITEYVESHWDDLDQMKRLPILMMSFFNVEPKETEKLINNIMERLTQ